MYRLKQNDMKVHPLSVVVNTRKEKKKKLYKSDSATPRERETAGIVADKRARCCFRL